MKRSLILICTLWLTSCANTTPQSQTPLNKNVSWDSRVQTLSGIENWDLNALIAIRNRKDDATASLTWQQNRKNYTLNVFGPLGTNPIKLSGKPGQVALQNAHGQIFYASTPEALLAQQTGYQLPVSGLYYWIRGLPVPGTPSQTHFDTYHHLVELDQQGWKIQYLRYTSVHQIDLPTKIFLVSPDLSVKIIINKWQL